MGGNSGSSGSGSGSSGGVIMKAHHGHGLVVKRSMHACYEKSLLTNGPKCSNIHFANGTNGVPNNSTIPMVQQTHAIGSGPLNHQTEKCDCVIL